jgi:hypothetical protein
MGMGSDVERDFRCWRNRPVINSRCHTQHKNHQRNHQTIHTASETTEFAPNHYRSLSTPNPTRPDLPNTTRHNVYSRAQHARHQCATQAHAFSPERQVKEPRTSPPSAAIAHAIRAVSNVDTVSMLYATKYTPFRLQQYVSPSDEIMSPATQKLQAFKTKHAMKK